MTQAVSTLNAAVSKQEEYYWCSASFLCVEYGDLTLMMASPRFRVSLPSVVGNILLDAEVCFHGDSKSIQIVNEG